MAEEALAVVFGAGNIGKGLLGELFQDAGLKTVFIEKDSSVVEPLRRAGSYRIRLHRPGEVRTRRVHGFEVCRPDEPMAERSLRCAQICATAEGPPNLASVARSIAAASRQRSGLPWNALVCENRPQAAEELRGWVATQLAGARAQPPSFVQCCVERMVAQSTVGTGGEVFVDGEYWYPLFADGSHWRGGRPDWRGLEFVPDVKPYFDRKLYTNNLGHALLGYVGHMKGYTKVWEAAEDAEISALLEKVLCGVVMALFEEHDLWTRESLQRYVDVLTRERYVNQALGDMIYRVCRDPVRKLGPDERIVGPIRLLEKHGLPTAGLDRIIAGAVLFAIEQEPGSGFRKGMDKVEMADLLASITGLAHDSELINDALGLVREQGG